MCVCLCLCIHVYTPIFTKLTNLCQRVLGVYIYLLDLFLEHESCTRVASKKRKSTCFYRSKDFVFGKIYKSANMD